MSAGCARKTSEMMGTKPTTLGNQQHPSHHLHMNAHPVLEFLATTFCLDRCWRLSLRTIARALQDTVVLAQAVERK